METTPRPKKPSRIYGILATLALMLLAFVAGIFVGIHPEWVPDMPWAYHPTVDEVPPTTQHSPFTPMDNPQTQPEPTTR
jgi:hypothetical protein